MHSEFQTLRTQYVNAKVLAASGLAEDNSGRSANTVRLENRSLADLRATADTIVTTIEEDAVQDIEDRYLVEEGCWDPARHGVHPGTKGTKILV